MRAVACKSRNDALRRLLRREAGRAAAAAACRYLGTVRPRTAARPTTPPTGSYAAFRPGSPPTIDDVRIRPAARPSWSSRRFAIDEPWPNNGARLQLMGAVRRKSSAVAEEATHSSEFAIPVPPGTVPLPFLLADIGEGIAEVELLEWHVSPGDRVEEHQTVCDVQSDKATVPLTSRYAGVVVDLCGMKGDMVSTGSPLMHVAVEAGKYGTDAAAGAGGVAGGAAETPAAERPAPPPPAAAAPASPLAPSPGAGKKVVPFLLADIGEGIAEVEILQWFVRPGDAVRDFDRVCEVQSDKASVEIPSRFTGTVTEVCAAKGDMVSTGSPLLFIEVENDTEGGTVTAGGGEVSVSGGHPPGTLHNADAVADRLHIPSVTPSHFPTVEEAAAAGVPPAERAVKVLASPAVRKMGKDHGIDLSTIAGSGPKGRILKADMLKIVRAREPPAAVEAPVAVSAAAAAAAAPGQPTEEGAPPSQQQQPQRPLYVPGEDVVVPLRGYSRLMVKTMTASLQIPHMVYGDEVDASALLEARSKLRPLAEARGIKLTLLPFMIKAASLAMRDYPVINASLDAENNAVTYHGNHDIGVAVDTPRGLTVPVVRRCQERSVLEIAEELGRLQELAAQGSLSETDLSSPTFTLSNIGSIGGTYMSPVVSPPQVAICAVGKIQRLPRFVGNTDKVEEAHIMNVSWGGDHRVVDGATMARFANLWRGYVEDPVSMTLAMR